MRVPSLVSYEVSTKDGQTLKRHIDQLYRCLLSEPDGSRGAEPFTGLLSQLPDSPPANADMEDDFLEVTEPEPQPDPDPLPPTGAVATTTAQPPAATTAIADESGRANVSLAFLAHKGSILLLL